MSHTEADDDPVSDIPKAGVSQLMYSTPPQYRYLQVNNLTCSFFFTTYLILWTILTIGSVYLIIYLITNGASFQNGPLSLPGLIIAIVLDCLILLFVLVRLPVRYQVHTDKFTCTTIPNYIPILPAFLTGLLSRGYTVHFSDVERMVFYESPTDHRRSSCHAGYWVLFPNTWTSFTITIKIYVNRTGYWSNFILTPLFPRQLASQFKRYLTDYRTEHGYQENNEEIGLVGESDEELSDDEPLTPESASEVTFAAK